MQAAGLTTEMSTIHRLGLPSMCNKVILSLPSVSCFTLSIFSCSTPSHPHTCVQIWDMKAVRDASQQALAVFPEHLRPAPFDAMRLTYLEHLNVRRDSRAEVGWRWGAGAFGTGKG